MGKGRLRLVSVQENEAALTKRPDRAERSRDMRKGIRATVLITIIISLTGLLSSGCSRYTEEYWRSMDLQKQKLLNPEGEAGKAEYQLDRAVAEAFGMMMQTIPPSDRRVKRLGVFNPLRFYDRVWRVGFVEAASPSAPPTRLDDYVAEKTLILARLDREFNRFFEMTERTRPEDMLRDLNLSGAGMPDAGSMARWGKMHNLDFVITGVTAVSPGKIDISLKLEQLPGGRVVAVGSSKMARNEVIDGLLKEPVPKPPVEPPKDSE